MKSKQESPKHKAATCLKNNNNAVQNMSKGNEQSKIQDNLTSMRTEIWKQYEENDKAAQCVAQWKAANKKHLATQKKLKEAVQKKETKLRKYREEWKSLQNYLQGASEREQDARTRLETFVSHLLDRASRAEAELGNLQNRLDVERHPQEMYQTKVHTVRSERPDLQGLPGAHHLVSSGQYSGRYRSGNVSRPTYHPFQQMRTSVQRRPKENTRSPYTEGYIPETTVEQREPTYSTSSPLQHSTAQQGYSPPLNQSSNYPQSQQYNKQTFQPLLRPVYGPSSRYGHITDVPGEPTNRAMTNKAHQERYSPYSLGFMEPSHSSKRQPFLLQTDSGPSYEDHLRLTPTLSHISRSYPSVDEFDASEFTNVYGKSLFQNTPEVSGMIDNVVRRKQLSRTRKPLSVDEDGILWDQNFSTNMHGTGLTDNDDFQGPGYSLYNSNDHYRERRVKEYPIDQSVDYPKVTRDDVSSLQNNPLPLGEKIGKLLTSIDSQPLESVARREYGCKKEHRFGNSVEFNTRPQKDGSRSMLTNNSTQPIGQSIMTMSKNFPRTNMAISSQESSLVNTSDVVKSHNYSSPDKRGNYTAFTTSISNPVGRESPLMKARAVQDNIKHLEQDLVNQRAKPSQVYPPTGRQSPISTGRKNSELSDKTSLSHRRGSLLRSSNAVEEEIQASSLEKFENQTETKTEVEKNDNSLSPERQNLYSSSRMPAPTSSTETFAKKLVTDEIRNAFTSLSVDSYKSPMVEKGEYEGEPRERRASGHSVTDESSQEFSDSDDESVPTVRGLVSGWEKQKDKKGKKCSSGNMKHLAPMGVSLEKDGPVSSMGEENQSVNKLRRQQSMKDFRQQCSFDRLKSSETDLDDDQHVIIRSEDNSSLSAYDAQIVHSDDDSSQDNSNFNQLLSEAQEQQMKQTNLAHNDREHSEAQRVQQIRPSSVDFVTDSAVVANAHGPGVDVGTDMDTDVGSMRQSTDVATDTDNWKESVDVGTDVEQEKQVYSVAKKSKLVVKALRVRHQTKRRAKPVARRFRPEESVSSSADELDDSQKAKKRAIRKMRRVLLHVFAYLDTDILLRMSEVCKEWCRVSRNPTLWRKVVLKDKQISSQFLITLSERCSQTHVLVLQGLRGRSILAEEEPEKYAENIRGSLELGLEKVLSACQDTIVSLQIEDCDNIVTDKCLWLISGYSRLLTHLTYRSALDSITGQLVWALGGGCPGITSLYIQPLHPRSETNTLNNHCLLLISQFYNDLREVGLGGKLFDMAGLLPLVQSCQQLRHVHLENCMTFTADVASALSRSGLKHLQTLSLWATSVEGKALEVLQGSCRHLKKVHIKLRLEDCVNDLTKKKERENYKKLVKTLEDLMSEPGFGNILQLDLVPLEEKESSGFLSFFSR